MRVQVVEERKVVGSVLGSTGLLSLRLVALGAGGTRPGTGEKKDWSEPLEPQISTYDPRGTPGTLDKAIF